MGPPEVVAKVGAKEPDSGRCHRRRQQQSQRWLNGSDRWPIISRKTSESRTTLPMTTTTAAVTLTASVIAVNENDAVGSRNREEVTCLPLLSLVAHIYHFNTENDKIMREGRNKAKLELLILHMPKSLINNCRCRSCTNQNMSVSASST